MTDTKKIVQRIERGQERDWSREYARLLPPVPTPTHTPGCICDWIEEKLLCVAEPIQHHTRFGKTAPIIRSPRRCLEATA